MKLTINYNREQLEDALETKLKVLQRKAAAERNPGIVALLDKDISDLRAAINTIAETK